MAKTEEVGLERGNCGDPCVTTFGSVANVARDVTIQSVKERQLNVRTHAPIAGTERAVQPAAVPADALAALRARLRSFVYDPDDCPDGCFCLGEGLSTSRIETLTFTVTIMVERKRASAWIAKGARTREEVLDGLRDGSLTARDPDTSAPVPIDADRDEIQITAENCCGQVTLDLDILNWFEYEFELQGEVVLVDEIGTCYDEDGPVPV